MPLHGEKQCAVPFREHADILRLQFHLLCVLPWRRLKV